MKNNHYISNWLFLICFMLIGMIALGGYTRLTGSGLSIMDWHPVTGMIPPLSHEEWVREFNLYKTIPQYTILNNGFGLEGFQRIFWAEWFHRFWGRLIGFILLVPLIWFAIKGYLNTKLILKLLLFFVLGGLQGAIGWFMVKSGFDPNSTAVEPLRLVLHLSFALILYAAILWTALSIRNPEPEQLPQTSYTGWIKALLIIDCILLAITIIAGGFTAGTHAGFGYNTFPLMNEHLIPTDYAKMTPFWLNWFKNIPAIQFNHRLLATVTLLMILITAFIGFKASIHSSLQKSFALLGWSVVIQYVLGITTLLLVVPVWAGTVHQTFAAILLTILIIVIHQLRKPRIRSDL